MNGLTADVNIRKFVVKEICGILWQTKRIIELVSYLQVFY